MEKTLVPRKIFTVIIHNSEYDVYNINDKEHDGLNGEPKTWWLYHTHRLPEGTLPPPNSEYFVPFSRSINRRLWDIRFKQSNSTKEKWGDVHFRNHTNVEMYCNNKLVYSFGTTGDNTGLSFAMGKVEYLKVVMSEHPYDFFEPKNNQGRKIFWYGLPATVKVGMDTWEISIIPDYTTGLSKEEWWNELNKRKTKITNIPDEDDEMEMEDDMDSKMSDRINWGDALSDQHISWFRK